MQWRPSRHSATTITKADTAAVLSTRRSFSAVNFRHLPACAHPPAVAALRLSISGAVPRRNFLTLPMPLSLEACGAAGPRTRAHIFVLADPMFISHRRHIVEVDIGRGPPMHVGTARAIELATRLHGHSLPKDGWQVALPC